MLLSWLSQEMRTEVVVTFLMWKLLTEGRGQSSASLMVRRCRSSKLSGAAHCGPTRPPRLVWSSHFLFWLSHNFCWKDWQEQTRGLSGQKENKTLTRRF